MPRIPSVWAFLPSGLSAASCPVMPVRNGFSRRFRPETVQPFGQGGPEESQATNQRLFE